MNILTHNFNEVYFVIGLFISVFLYNVINVGYWIKRFLNIKISKRVAILDCYSCFSFWTTLALTQSIFCAMLVWSIIHVTQNKD